MEKVITDDGSVTFRSMDVDECYHTKSGALEESFKKHVEPSDLAQMAKTKQKIVIFDVCFGLGYNSAAAIDTIKKVNPNCKIIIYGFENDQNILDKILEIDPEFGNFSLIKDIVKSHCVEKDNINIKIILGDAKKEIIKISQKADIVFFDPFSPKKAPEMWSADFFSDIYKKMNIGGNLTTYSCARIVRDNLKKASFIVVDGPVVGRRSPSTIAKKR